MLVFAETDDDVSWGVSDGTRADGVGAAAHPIAASRCSYAPTGLRPEASWVATRMASANWANFKYSEPPPRTCRSELVRDLARSGSKVSECGVSDGAMANGFGAAAQPIAAVVTSGRSYRYRVVVGSDVPAHADLLLPRGRGSVACPAICRVAAAKPEHSVCLMERWRVVLGLLRSPSRPRGARTLLQACGQKRVGWRREWLLPGGPKSEYPKPPANL
jgi:hypothetical protein